MDNALLASSNKPVVISTSHNLNTHICIAYPCKQCSINTNSTVWVITGVSDMSNCVNNHILGECMYSARKAISQWL